MGCQNPFGKCEGKGDRIAVIIRIKGRNYEVCEGCWAKIADSDIQWGEPLPRLVEVKSPLGIPSLTEVIEGK